jgi:hypothetical protein
MMKKPVIRGIVMFAILLALFVGVNFFLNPTIGKIDGWNIHRKQFYSCSEKIEVIYELEGTEYYFDCEESDRYVVQKGYAKLSLQDALEEEKVTIEALQKVIKSLNTRPKE